MSYVPFQRHLAPIRESLERLNKQPLPDGLRQELKANLEHINELSEKLSTDVEPHKLEVLYSVSQAVGASLDLDEVLTRVMDAIILLTGAERGFLMLAEEAGVEDPHSLRLRVARNVAGESLSKEEIEVSQTMIRSVLDSGKSLVTTNAQHDPRFARQQSVTLFNLRGILCAPLRVRGSTIGVIYVDNRAQIGLFSQEDLSLLDTFAVQAAAAIANARLYERVDQELANRIRELEILSQIDQDLNAHLDLQRVLDTAHRKAIEVTGADQGWIALFNDHSLRTAAGENKEATWEQNEGAAEAVNEKPIKVQIPLQRAETKLGILALEKKTGFSSSEIQLLRRLGERASAAIENARLYQAVQDANLAKSKFVSVVTHELRIPMTSIKGYTDLLRQGAVGPVNDMQSNFLNVIRSNVDRMNNLVSDLSDISRLETGRIQLEPGAVSVTGALHEAVLTLRPRFEEKEQIIELDVPEDLPPAYADSSRLVQIANNLIGNANKYTQQGGQVAVRAFQQDENVRVEVIDNGIGIDQEDQEKLFQQFFRSENEAVREQQGWGLGLNVTKRLVELMGGEIGADSTLNIGSTFWFTIPIYQGGHHD